MKSLSIITIALALQHSGDRLSAEVEGASPLLRERFDGSDESDFAGSLISHRNITLANGAGPDGSNAIRVAYVGSDEGSERVVVRHPIGSKVDAATLSFDVKFDRDFQWVRGGKLHGLSPKSPITGGRERQPGGWSARIMWRDGGRCSTYLYDQDETKEWGIGGTARRAVFTAGRWHHVTLQVRLNDPGVANGFARILVDGREVVRSEKVTFRGIGGDETRIQQFLFSTFHGGHDRRYAPVDGKGKPTTVYAYFDNFEVKAGIGKAPSRQLTAPLSKAGTVKK